MKKYGLWILLLLSITVLLYTCKVTQYPVQRDATGRILVNPHPDPAPLSPQESMKHMYLPKGYHLQLVASEPMVSEPVAVVWDGNGVMYVAEMLTYMVNIDGTGEGMKLCTIKRLEDTDGDGVMDKATVFIDSLVLPRMILPVGHRLLVSETNSNNIYSYGDTNGDGRADVKKIVYKNETIDVKNLEHQKSGLMWNLDNRIYVTVDAVRYNYNYRTNKLSPDSLRESPGGQWGLTSDDYGRMYFSSAGGETPALNFQQNPYYGQFNFRDQFNPDFQAVWPIIATPDVQGGLLRLRADSTLNHFTACTGQSIFRGDKLPADMRGDLFICEPVGRLIRRAKITNTDAKITMVNAYDKQEFLASSDLNFRPVNTVTGPDGCMYIVDMYHGIIQESNWTKEGSYLRPKILQKGLQKNVGRGRIYRLVYDGFKPTRMRPKMLDETSAQLVTYLDNPNGWWRDNAQKELVLRDDKYVIPALKKMALTSPNPLGRIHALWTLNGMEALDQETFNSALKDSDPHVRKTTVWIGEDLVKKDKHIIDQMVHLKDDPNADVRFQLDLSLRYNADEKAQATVAYLGDHSTLTSVLAQSNQVYKNFLAQKAAIEKTKSLMLAADSKLVAQGAIIFKQLCAACHGLDAKGVTIGGGKLTAPVLASNKDVNGNPDKLVRILLLGLSGPVDGKAYADIMPALGGNDDDYIASVLSYVRNDFGNKAPTVKPDDVKKIRAELAGRTTGWTMPELDSLQVKVMGKK